MLEPYSMMGIKLLHIQYIQIAISIMLYLFWTASMVKKKCCMYYEAALSFKPHKNTMSASSIYLQFLLHFEKSVLEIVIDLIHYDYVCYCTVYHTITDSYYALMHSLGYKEISLIFYFITFCVFLRAVIGSTIVLGSKEIFKKCTFSHLFITCGCHMLTIS